MTQLSFSEIWYWFLVMAVVSYFIGCFNFALVISRFKHKDVRKMGSGNPGTMNMSRQFGLKIGAITLFCDMVKAGIPVLAGYFIFRGCVFAGTDVLVSDLARYVCGVFVIVGHIYPVTMKFKGGKGILSGGVVAIMIDWRIAVVVWGGFLILTALTRYVSLGSLWAGASFPFISWYCYPQTPIIVLAFCLGGLIVWKHRANIQRLLAGNENKLSFHRKKT